MIPRHAGGSHTAPSAFIADGMIVAARPLLIVGI